MNASIEKAIAKIRELISDNNAAISNIIPVLAGDSESLKPFKDLLSKSVIEPILLKNRYIFIKTAVQCDSHTFWKTIIPNLGMGAEYDINNQNIFVPVSKILYDKTFDDAHARKILMGILKINSKISIEEWEDSSVKKSIDEIPKHGKLAHGIDDTEGNRKKLIFYSHIREALFDWSKQNKWVLSNEDSDGYKEDFNFLILDDVIWKEDWPEKGSREEDFKTYLEKCLDITNKLSGRKWTVYRLKKHEDGVNRFAKQIENILEDKDACLESIFSTRNKANSSSKLKDFLEKTKITHILVDWMLDESGQYSGLNLVRQLNSWIDRNKKKLNIIPEILILSRSNDPVTIQSALDAGASGYIVKDNIGELPLIVGRAGQPLSEEQADKINSLLRDNFPSLRSFPAFVSKALYFDRWKKIKKFDPSELQNIEDEYEENDSIIEGHKRWLKQIPKTDLHVHFGTAIPLNICYDLAIISVYRWLNQYKYEAGSEYYKGRNGDGGQQITDAKNPKGNYGKYIQIKDAANLIKSILNETIKKTKNNEDEFRDNYLNAFKEITGMYEVATVNNTIKRLNSRFDKLTEEQISCLLVTGLGIISEKHDKNSLQDRIGEIVKICNFIEGLELEKEKNILLSFYLQDSGKIIKAIKGFYQKLKSDEIIEKVYEPFNDDGKLEKNKINEDALSNLLSISESLQDEGQGLLKYLGAGDLVGASLLQFAETLLLASYHIVKWAKKYNVWHMELRAGPTGYLKGLNNSTISTKIMLLGLYAGLHVHDKNDVIDKNDNHLTPSVLICAKRHKEKEEIKESVQIATEFIAKNEEAAKETNSKGFIPKVLGMDLAGAERGNLPEDLVEHFRESFKRCLMTTVHAGEDESVESVWQAVYSLHASRVGHGLRLDDHQELKRLFKDRQLCVELCPKSNQFTNGYDFYNKNNPHKETYYVFENYWEYGIPLTINTDNPLFSHRANDEEMSYPLCEEYLILPHLLGNNSKGDVISDNKRFFINRLLILKLIYNGFKHSFLNPEDKANLIEHADTEVFNTLAKEFLDVCISAER